MSNATGDRPARSSTQLPTRRFGEVSGRILHQGAAVPSVRVAAASVERSGKQPRFHRQTHTDAAGRFRLRLPIRHADGQRYTLHWSRKGYLPGNSSVLELRHGQPVPFQEFSLKLDPLLHGKPFAFEVVVRDHNRQPVPTARVRLLTGNTDRDQMLAYLHAFTTDDQGRVRVQGKGHGNRVLVVRAAKQGLRELRQELQVTAAMGPVELRMQPGLEIRGQVTDLQGKPVPRLSLRALQDGRSWQDGFEAAIEADGSFRLQGLDDAKYRLSGWASEFSSFTLTAVQAGNHEVRVRMKPAAMKRAAGTHDGEIHATVRDTEGRLVKASWWDWDVRHVRAGLSEKQLRFDLLPRLLHPRPVQRAASGRVPEPSPEFHARGLQPGRYMVLLRRHGKPIGYCMPVEVERNQVVVTTVRIAAATQLAGQVLDRHGSALVGATVMLVGEGSMADDSVDLADQQIREARGRNRLYWSGVVQTKADGRFVLQHVPLGWRLRAVAIHKDFEPVRGPMFKVAKGLGDLQLRFVRTR